MTEQQQQQQPQANGEYPRLNSAMVASGRYNGLLVSLVGRFQEGGRLFACCDGGTVPLSVEHMDESAMHLIHNTNTGMVVEVVGQISSPSLVAVFVVRELSTDMDLDVYNRMISIQHNPKFAHYFKAPLPTN